MIYKFTLPQPVSVNAVWRGTGKHIHLSDRSKAYRVKVYEAMHKLKLVYKRVGGPVSVEMVFYPPDKRKRDLDNNLKSLFDALTFCQFWNDDQQVHKITMCWGEVTKGGKVDMIVTEINQPRGKK